MGGVDLKSDLKVASWSNVRSEFFNFVVECFQFKILFRGKFHPREHEMNLLTRKLGDVRIRREVTKEDRENKI